MGYVNVYDAEERGTRGGKQDNRLSFYSCFCWRDGDEVMLTMIECWRDADDEEFDDKDMQMLMIWTLYSI